MQAKKIKFSLFLLLLWTSIILHSQKTPINSVDVFGTKVFVENKGQFNSSVKSSEPILFAYEHGVETIYFTTKGLIYKQVEAKSYSKHKMEELEEKLENGKNIDSEKPRTYQILMEWENSNVKKTLIPSLKQSYYFTFGDEEDKASAYKKITYKNVYNNIDIEYIIPEGKEFGIKYNVILNKGAHLSDVKFSYSGDVKDIILDKGNRIVVKTPVYNIVEHEIFCFQENNPGRLLTCSYQLDGQKISFNIDKDPVISERLIIDPWVTSVTTFNSNNYAYDVDFDNAGNLYAHGGNAPFKVAKYNSAGILQWTFSGVLSTPVWNSSGDYPPKPLVGNFIVEKSSQKCYVGQGWVLNGTRIIRLNANGLYDNFITPANIPLKESWDFAFNCVTNELVSLGGHEGANTSGGIINQVTGGLVPTTFYQPNSGSGHDVVSGVIDENGTLFVIYASAQTAFMNNKIARVNATYNNATWIVPSTYTSFAENDNKAGYLGSGLGLGSSNGFNCLAVSNTHLFYYDGFNLAAYNKLNGAQISATTVPGYTLKRQGGIAVDDCGNIYLGGNNNIVCYNFNGTSFSPLATIPLSLTTTYPYIYDLKLDKNSNTLFVSGSGFVGTYNAIHTSSCSMNNVAITTTCSISNLGVAVASISTNFSAPLFNYIWSTGTTTVSSTLNSTLNTNSVNNLNSGTYTLQSQINAPCGPVFVNTITINCQCAVFPTITPITCSQSQASATLGVSCSSVTSIVWNPAPGAIAGNSLSASAMNPGTYTISTFNGTILTSTTAITINSISPFTFTVTSVSGSSSITCLNPSLNLTAHTNYTAGAVTFVWMPGVISGSAIVTSPTTTTNYTVIASSNGCIVSSNFLVSVYPNPVISAIASQSLVCIGNSATLSASGADIYTWNPGNINNISIIVNPTSTSIYTVTGTNTLTTCQSTKTIAIQTDKCLGTGDLMLKEHGLEVFPNPNSGVFKIRSKNNLSLLLINELGQEIKQIELNEQNNQESTIKDIADGIYFITNRNDRSLNYKIIVTH